MNTESTLRRLFRKRITLKRRRPAADGTPRDFGVGVTGVVVTIVILGILAAIGGPPLWRLITDAREHKLNSNLQSAAQVMRDRLTLEPEWMGTDGVAAKAGTTPASGEGDPEDDLVTVLIEDVPFTWSKTWELSPGTDEDETIHVQFIGDGAVTDPAAATPPQVPWLLSDWRAVRVQAANTDGAWACALIVLRPNVPEANVWASGAGVPGSFKGTTPTFGGADSAKRTMDAWLGGIWYDSGESYASAVASEEHCSPAGLTGQSPGTDHAWLPVNADTWVIDPDGAGTGTDRTLSRNL